jgi:hypothetical protein
MGWQLWVEDLPSVPAAESGVGTPGMVGGPTWTPSGASAPSGFPMANVVTGREPREPVPPRANVVPAWPEVPGPDALNHRRSAARRFWIGVLLFVICAATFIASAGDEGGVIWTGGLVVGLGFMVRAWNGYRAARADGAPAYSPLGWTGAVGAVTGCVALVVVGIVAHAVPGSVMPHASTGVGSCWTRESLTSDMLKPVDCGTTHEYAGTSVVDVVDDCGWDSVMYVEADEGGYLCLSEDS